MELLPIDRASDQPFQQPDLIPSWTTINSFDTRSGLRRTFSADRHISSLEPVQRGFFSQGLRLCTGNPAIVLTGSTIAIVTHISRSEDTVQQPGGNPIRAMFALGRSSIEHDASLRLRSRILPRLSNGTLTTLVSNVMPEERRLIARVRTLRLCETRPVAVQGIVDSDGFILSRC